MKSRKISLRRFTIKEMFSTLILFCLFLASLNLINRFYYCIYIAAAFFIITPGRKFVVDKNLCLLFGLSLSLLIFDKSYQTIFTNMIKPFTYPLCYMIGLTLFNIGKDDDADLLSYEKKTSTLIYIVSGGVMAHFVLNMLLNIRSDTRHVIDYWTKAEMSATGQATLACLAIAIAVTFIFAKTGKKKKIIAIATILIILAYNLVLAGRTIFALMIIAFAVSVFYTMYENRRIGVNTKSAKLILAVLAIAVCLYCLYDANVFGVKSMFESSNFYDRFFGGDYTQDIDDDSRLANKLYYIEHFLDSMLGGGHIRASFGHSAHDLYLDTYDEAGIFALVSVGAYILMSLNRVWRCIRSTKISFETRLLVLSVYSVVNVQFWLEPIMRGIPWLLATYCLIDGAVNKLLMKEHDLLKR